MNRRNFVFKSMASALLFNSVFSIRRAEAEVASAMKTMFFVDSCCYPQPQDFFPSADGTLSPILTNFSGLKGDMVTISGITSGNPSPNPRGNHHVSSMGKLLTAKNVIAIPGEEDDALHGGISADQVIANTLNVNSLYLQVNSRNDGKLGARPFSRGKRNKIDPIRDVAQAWDKVFRDFQFDPKLQGNTDVAAKEERIRKLTANQSVLDGFLTDLSNLRRELVGAERIKLDAHESAIRGTERGVVSEIRRQTEALADTNTSTGTSQCTNLDKVTGSLRLDNVTKVHFDIMYTALLCDRIGVGGLLIGQTTNKMKYEWLSDVNVADGMHDVFHGKITNSRNKHIEAGRWNWEQLAKFATRLKDTPDGSGNMLNNILIYGTGHFGKNHVIDNLPNVLIGNAQGKLETGRNITVPKTNNAKILTSVMQLAGVDAKGIGDDPDSGGLTQIYNKKIV